MSNGAAKTWLDGGGWSIANQVYYSLTVGSVGGGNGQFSAWLADPSARSGMRLMIPSAVLPFPVTFRWPVTSTRMAGG